MNVKSNKITLTHIGHTKIQAVKKLGNERSTKMKGSQNTTPHYLPLELKCYQLH